MSNYTQVTFFAPKDSLLHGDPNKIIHGTQVDPELAAIAVAIASKFDVANMGGITQLAIGDGTASAPAYSFNSDTTTGMYKAAVTTLGFSSAGVQRGTVNGTGNWVLNAATGGAGTLTVSGAVAGQPAIAATVPNTTGYGVQITGTSGAASAAQLLSVQQSGFSNGFTVATDGTNMKYGFLSGNVTIGAPVSGTSLTINGTGSPLTINFANNAAGFTNWQTATVQRGYIGVDGGGILGSGAGTGFGIRSEAILLLLSGGGSFVTSYSASGNWTIAAPSGGTTLGISSLSGSQAINVSATSGAASSLFLGWNIGFAAAWALGTQSTDPFSFGTAGNATATLYTNSANRVTVTGAGNVSIASPSSGSSLAITVNNNVTGVSISDGTSTLAQQTDAGHTQYFGTSTAHALVLITSNASKFQIAAGTTSPIIQGYGPTAVALVDMTPDTGSFTITYTGFTANPTGTAIWARIGNLVMLFLPTATATSNAVSMTATGIPNAINPARAQWVGFAAGENNTTQQSVSVRVDAANTLTFGAGALGTINGFTASGTKGIAAGSTIYYLLN